MTTYGCVARWASGSDEWKSGTLEVLATWLAGGDFTEAVIQPIPSATLDMLRRATQPEQWAAQQELEAGYQAAAKSHGDSYASYLREHDAELAAKGFQPRPWPLCLQGNDGV